MKARLRSRRVVLIAVLTLAMVSAFVGGAFGSHVFSDVPTGAFYHDDVSWLVARGITAGCGGGKYCPDNAVTRGQMAVFLHKMANRTRTGHTSCDSRSFFPAFSAAGYLTDNNRRSTVNFMDQLSCGLFLPDGVTVTSFSVTAYDNDETGAFDCALNRVSLIEPVGVVTQMGITPSTSTTGGNQVLTDTTIGSATVDNANYSYVVDCNEVEAGATLAVNGAVVAYTYVGIPAP